MTVVRAGVVAILVAGISACSLKKDNEEPDYGPCVADTFEPADTSTSPWALGAIQDDDDPPPIAGGTKEQQNPTIIKKTFTTHVSGDIDWFSAYVKDSGLGGNPQISVIVSSGYEATVWFSCDNQQTESVVCGLGTSVDADPEHSGRGCMTNAATSGSSSVNVNLSIECANTSSDSGSLTIRVRRLTPNTSCERYFLTVAAN